MQAIEAAQAAIVEGNFMMSLDIGQGEVVEGNFSTQVEGGLKLNVFIYEYPNGLAARKLEVRYRGICWRTIKPLTNHALSAISQSRDARG